MIPVHGSDSVRRASRAYITVSINKTSDKIPRASNVQGGDLMSDV